MEQARKEKDAGREMKKKTEERKGKQTKVIDLLGYSGRNPKMCDGYAKASHQDVPLSPHQVAPLTAVSPDKSPTDKCPQTSLPIKCPHRSPPLQYPPKSPTEKCLSKKVPPQKVPPPKNVPKLFLHLIVSPNKSHTKRRPQVPDRIPGNGSRSLG